MQVIPSIVCIALLVCFFGQFPAAVDAQNINYFGVAYSPYVTNGLWNSFSLEDIKRMLRIVLTRHNSVSTYSMGVADYNVNGPWDKADSNCLIARAAGQINREHNSVVLSVSIGIYQNDKEHIQKKEIENAFNAAEDANRIKPGTVWGLVFTNEFIEQDKKPGSGEKVLRMIRENKDRARRLGLRVGTRTQFCQQVWGGVNQRILIEIAKESDFIMCNLYPGNNLNNVDQAVKGVSDAYYSSRDGFWRHKSLEVMIGETGWASQGKTFNNPPHHNTVENLKNFWEKMREWANRQKVKVHMFEAYDEPWKSQGEEGEKHFGWWKRENDYYVEKATGKRF